MSNVKIGHLCPIVCMNEIYVPCVSINKATVSLLIIIEAIVSLVSIKEATVSCVSKTGKRFFGEYILGNSPPLVQRRRNIWQKPKETWLNTIHWDYRTEE